MDRKARISKRTVDALTSEAKRYVLWDTDISGFGVKVSTTGRKTYILRYRVNGGRSGRSREPAIGTHGTLTPDQARDIARLWAAEVAKGGDPAGQREARREAPTMSDVLDRYLDEHVRVRNKDSTAQAATDMVERLIRPALGRLKIADVERSDIARVHQGLSSTPYQANRVLATLSKVFSLAETWGLRPDHSNPCPHIERFKEVFRERYLTIEEYARLSQALDQAEAGELRSDGTEGATVHVNPQAIRAIRLALMTGARIGEILGLRWEHIDWVARCANLPDSKTGKKTLNLSGPAFAALEQAAKRSNQHGYVIIGADGSDPDRPLVNIKDPWGLIRKAAGLEDVRLHDLRHAFASVGVASGLSLPVIGALLGHKEVRTTQRYAHLANTQLQEAANLIGARIGNAMASTKPKEEVSE